MGNQVVRQLRPFEGKALLREQQYKASVQPDRKHHGVPRFLGGGGEPTKSTEHQKSAGDRLKDKTPPKEGKGPPDKKGTEPTKSAHEHKKDAKQHEKDKHEKGKKEHDKDKKDKKEGKEGKGKDHGKEKPKGKGKGAGEKGGDKAHKKDKGKQGKDAKAPSVHGAGGRHGGGGGGDEHDLEFIAIPAIPMAKVGDFYPPIVEDPPLSVLKAEATIVNETGLPPRAHHAKVRLALEALTRTCAEMQLDMVRRVEALAWDTRFAIDTLADQIPVAVGGGVGLINGTIDKAKAETRASYQEAYDRIDHYEAKVGDDLVANREKAMKQIKKDLLAGSEKITSFAKEAEARFNGKLGTAQAAIKSVPLTGTAALFPMPPAPEKPAKPKQEREKDTGPTAPFTVKAARDEIEKNDLKAGTFHAETYERMTAVPLLDQFSDQRQEAAMKGAEKAAEQAGSETNRAQFLIVALGLTGPVAEDTKIDKPGNQTDEQKEAEKNRRAQLSAKKAALEDLTKSHDRAQEFLDEQKKKLAENLWKMGRKIENSLRNQARTAEVGIATAAAQMAQGYPDVLKKVEPLVAPGRFLDSRSTVPELDNAREGVLSLRQQHLQATKEQANETLKGAQEGFEQQRKEIWKSAREMADGTADGVTRAQFDFEVAAQSFTGQMGKGTEACMKRAIKYAEKVAERTLKEDAAKIKKGLDSPLDTSAASFLNGAINGELHNYNELVHGSRKEFMATGGPFQGYSGQVRSDISTRSSNIDAALPHRSTWGAIGLTVLSPVGGLYYLYATRSKEDVVLTNLGELKWPGAGAIEDAFNGVGPVPGRHEGTLQGRINDRMSDPQRRDAIGLLSGSANERWSARKETAETSTGIFTGPSKETREAVLKGLGQEEATYAMGSGEMAATKKKLQGMLSGSELEITEAYLDRNAGRVLAIRVEELKKKTLYKTDDDLVKLNDEVENLARQELGGTVKNAFVSQSQIDGLLTKMYVEHGKLMDERAHKGDAAFKPAPFDPTHVISKDENDAARVKFLEGMKERTEIRPLPGGGYEAVQVKVDPTAFKAIEAAVLKGNQSYDAKVARGVYEVKRAEKDGKPGETTQNRLTNALEDREYFNIKRKYDETTDPTEKAALKKQLDDAQAKHDKLMGDIAKGLEDADKRDPNKKKEPGESPDFKKPGTATAYMADRIGKAFAGVNHGEKYGREMIEGGRASLLTATMMATDKWGTNDDLLKQAWTGRSKKEIAGAKDKYAETHGGDQDALFKELGISKSTSFWDFAETSGDLAMELKKLSKGEPETDQDYAELAALEHQQQKTEGTGFLASFTMGDKPQSQELDDAKLKMAQTILDAAGDKTGDPGKVFGPDGEIQAPYNKSAFENGKLKGGDDARYKLREQTNNVKIASDNYKAEIDRQESLITGAITALAILVTVVLMCIPGVNLVVAGILTAVIAGAATMAVKYGMRGGRYGWEEAATDAGMTAIEAATAGIGGGLGKGAEAAASGAKAAGILGRTGAALTKTFGKMGGAVAREAIVGAIGGAARTAIQDETWQDGIGSGLKKVGLSGVKGAAASAVNTLVSQTVTGKLTGAMEKGMLEGAKAGPLGRMGAMLGPAGREMAAAVVSQSLGAMAATATDIVIDVATGHYHGTLKDALLAIGETGVKEMFSSALRTGAEQANKARYRTLLQAAREKGGTLSDQDRRTLRLAAISAGEDHYGLSPEEASAKAAAKARGEPEYDPKKARYEREVYEGREALNGLPKELRAQFAGLDAHTLSGLRELMGSPTLGTPQQRLSMLHALSHAHIDMGPEGLLDTLQKGRGALETKAAEEAQVRKQVQRALGEELEGPARKYLKDVPVEGLDKLGPADLRKASAMIKAGELDEAAAAQLLQSAKKANPGLNEEAFQANLKKAVQAVAAGRELERAARVKTRAEVLGSIAEEGRAAFADLPDDAVAKVKKLLSADAKASDQLKDQLYRAAAAENPGLKRDEFIGHLEKAAQQASHERSEARKVKQAERSERLAEYPPKVRGALSQLPEEALFQLRLAQARGEEISPQLRQSLHEAALRESPGADLKKLNAALDEAVKKPSEALKGVEGEKMRKQLESGVPEDQRQKLSKVAIMVMKAEDFDAFTGSASAEAVTLLVNGKPVVVMREGASPKVLREEGIHALQAQEPRWREAIGQLDEKKLSKWNELPLEEQLSLYRTKVEVEIDAHQRMVSGLENELKTARGDRREELVVELGKAKEALKNLGNRLMEVEHLDPTTKRAIELGLVSKARAAQFLEEAPRLFAKDAEGKRMAAPKAVKDQQVVLPDKGGGKITFRTATEEAEALIDKDFKVAQILKELGDKKVVLAAYDAGDGKGAKLQAVHPQDPDPLNPTRPPPELLVKDGKKWRLVQNTDELPPIKPHQDAYFEMEGGKVVVKQWGQKGGEGAGWEIVSTPKGKQLEYRVKMAEHLPEAEAKAEAKPPSKRAKAAPEAETKAPEVQIKPLDELPKIKVGSGPEAKEIDLSKLGRTLLQKMPGQLTPTEAAELMLLAESHGLLTDRLTFRAGPLDPKTKLTFLQSLENPFVAGAIREHMVHLLATEQKYAASPHALAQKLGAGAALGEQHSHLTANATAKFLMAQGDKAVEGLVRSLASKDAVAAMHEMDALSRATLAETGSGQLRSTQKVIELANELAKRYQAYRNVEDPDLRPAAHQDVHQALTALLEGLAVAKPPTLTLDQASTKLDTGSRFFGAYMFLQKAVVEAAVGKLDARVARELLAARPSALLLGMEEIRFGTGNKALLGDTTTLENLDRGYIISVPKRLGRMNLEGGPEYDVAGLRQLVRDFFGGKPELARLVGLDSSGVEGKGKSPISHAREFTERTLFNLQESVGRAHALLDTNPEVMALLRARVASLGPEGEQLQRFMKAHGNLAEAMETFQGTYQKAQKELHDAFAEAAALKKGAESASPDVKKQVGEKATAMIDEALKSFLETRYGGVRGVDGSPTTAGLKLQDLAHLNRLAVDVLRQTGMMGEGVAEPGNKTSGRVKQLGLTIHAGEQIKNYNALALLDDVDMSMRLGADRLGHAVVLGLSGNELVQMGAKLSKQEVAQYDQRRRELLARAKALGIVIELNITSNLNISNFALEMHAATRLTQAGLRVSVSTDDEVLLDTTVLGELHKFAQVKGVGVADVAMAALEAFASRMGTFELQQAERLIPQWKQIITDLQPEANQQLVIQALASRYLGRDVLAEARARNMPLEKLLDEVLKKVFH